MLTYALNFARNTLLVLMVVVAGTVIAFTFDAPWSRHAGGIFGSFRHTPFAGFKGLVCVIGLIIAIILIPAIAAELSSLQVHSKETKKMEPTFGLHFLAMFAGIILYPCLGVTLTSGGLWWVVMVVPVGCLIGTGLMAYHATR